MEPATRQPAEGTQGLSPEAVRIAVLALALALALPPAADAARLRYLARDEELCDGARLACVQGTLTYDGNPRLLWLRGRMTLAPGPGLLQITLRGTTRLGHVRYAPMEIELRGRSGEIVDFRMIPDHPDVADWAIDRIAFLPGRDR